MTNSDMIVNNLCESISMIVNGALSQLKYDTTIICTIVDASKSANGEYRVKDGSVEFVARSENTTYKKGEQVRVSIPNGDNTQEKFIIGKYINDKSNVPITYMDPLDSVMKMTNNLFDNDTSTVYSLCASGYKENGEATPYTIQLPTIQLDKNASSMINTQIYDTIFLQAEFKTTLSNYNMISGHYGLLLRLGQHSKDGFTSTMDCIFDSSQMLGNPYSFGIYTQQAAKFDVTSLGMIDSVQLYFYQDGTFQHTTHSEIPQNVIKDEKNPIPNLLIKNITIGFGTDVSKVADDTVKLFTLDENKYDGNGTEEERKRTLKVAWYNKNELGQSIGFSDGAGTNPKKDDPWEIVSIGNEQIKFIDEETYAKDAELNYRRSAQLNYDIPMDATGLELAATIKEIDSELNSLSLLLSKDLHQQLEKFKVRCNLNFFKGDDYAKLSEVINAQIVDTENSLNLLTVTQNMCNSFTDGLNRAAKKYNVIPDTIEGEGWKFKAETTNRPTLIDYTEQLTKYFDTTLYESFYDEEGIFLSSLYTDIITNYSGYKGIYDNFKLRIEKILTNIKDKWQLIKNNKLNSKIIDETSKSLSAWIMTYWEPNFKFNQWEEKDLTKYDNAYCVYWYRANKLAKTDGFAGDGWERIQEREGGLSDCITYEERQILLNPELEKEEFKVIIFFNHSKYESNSITFENTIDFNVKIANMSNYITILHGENSQESYQSYSATNTLINGADKYVKRKLNITYTNHETGELENDTLIGAQIYWYVPKNSTMITFDTTDLNSLNVNNKFTNDIAAKQDSLSERQKQGYFMFYKTINSNEDGAVNTDDLMFTYRIKDYYVPSATQNHILCDVLIGEIVYSTEILMNFSSYGTSGTDYTLTVSPHGSQAAISNNNTIDNPWRLDISFYNNKNEKIELPEGSSLGLNLLIDTNVKLQEVENNLIFFDETNNQHYCNLYLEDNLNKELFNILEVKLQNTPVESRAYDLTTYYPIAYTADLDAYIEGASIVVYDSNGGNPTYYKDKYKFFNNNTQQTVKWELHYTPSDEDNDNWKKNVAPYMPRLLDESLLPCTMWVENCDVLTEGNSTKTYYPYVECFKEDSEVASWIQPIVIMQNRYASPMLNSWDGSLKIDEQNGTILSTMVGAGRKNSDNTFSGVLMGDVDVAETETGNHSGLGLYGFHHGAQSFGFNIDGTAFLGKADGGRLEFDGNKGTIKSASYENINANGMLIDFDDGIINIKEGGSNGRVSLNMNGPYFEIISSNNESLIHINKNDYYLKTDNFDGKSQGVKIDLGQGEFIGYNFKLEALDSDQNGIKLNSNGTPYINVVTNNGNNVLLNVSKNTFLLQSQNWNEKNQGTQIDLYKDTIQSFNFDLTAYTSDEEEQKFITLTSNNTKAFPFNVNDKFTISWDGSFAVGINAFNVDSEGNLSLGNGAFSVTKDGNLTIGENIFNIDNVGNFWINAASLEEAPFYVNKEGAFKATKGTIGGWNIDVDKLTSNITNEIQTLDDGTAVPTQTMTLGCNGTITIGTISQAPEDIFASGGQSFGFNIDNTGRMTSQCAYLNACTINGALLIPGKIKIWGNASITNDVNLQRTFDQKYVLDVNDDACFRKFIIMGRYAQITSWSEPYLNDPPDKYKRPWISFGFINPDHVWYPEVGETDGGDSKIAFGAQELEFVSQSIIFGNVSQIIREEVNTGHEIQIIEREVRPPTSVKIYGKEWLFKTLNKIEFQDNTQIYLGNPYFNKDNEIISLGTNLPNILSNIQQHNIYKDSFSACNQTVGEDTVVIEPRTSSLKVYMVMLILEVLDRLNIFKKYATDSNGKNYENIAHFARYMSDQQINEQYQVFNPYSKT